MTEQYYIWQRNALQGGTVTDGTPHPYFEGTGPGKLLHGLSDSYGVVNYTSYVLSDKAVLVFRSDCLADFQGQRTGIPGAYFENTLGYVRHLTSWPSSARRSVSTTPPARGAMTTAPAANSSRFRPT